jgi:TM2 domain-containing membrane protein YozV
MKSRIIAGLLALFLGGLGVHKFYLGQTKKGLIYLVLSWTCVPAVLSFIEAILIFSMTDEDFQFKYPQPSL